MSRKTTDCIADSKSKSLVSIIHIIEQLEPGQISLLHDLVQGYVSASKGDSSSVAGLSPRELDVLTLLANGYTRKNISDTLGISKNTAARHICNIYTKIKVSSVAEATQYAYVNNLCLVRAAADFQHSGGFSTEVISA